MWEGSTSLQANRAEQSDNCLDAGPWRKATWTGSNIVAVHWKIDAGYAGKNDDCRASKAGSRRQEQITGMHNSI